MIVDFTEHNDKKIINSKLDRNMCNDFNNLEIFNLLLPFINKTDILFKNKKGESVINLAKGKILRDVSRIIHGH